MNNAPKISDKFNAAGIITESLGLGNYYFDVSNHLCPDGGRFPEISVQIRDCAEARAVYQHAKALFDTGDYKYYCRWTDDKTGKPIGALEFYIFYKGCRIFLRFYAFEYITEPAGTGEPGVCGSLAPAPRIGNIAPLSNCSRF